jgi:hypothetical protein
MFLKKRAVVGIVGGLWAMIPDLDYLIQGLSLHSESWTDIYIFHYSFDQALSETDLYFAGEMLLIFAVVNFFAFALVVESFNRLKEAMFGKKEEDEEEEGEEEPEKEKKGEDNTEEPKGDIVVEQKAEKAQEEHQGEEGEKGEIMRE